MPEDVNGTGGGMQIGTPGSFGNQGRIVGVNSNNPLGVVSSGSGDIILNNNGEKKKVWKVMAIVIVALVLVGVGVLVVMRFGGFGKSSLRKLEALVRYIENGDGFYVEEDERDNDVDEDIDDEEGDLDENFIYAIGVSNEGPMVASDYYVGLEKKEEDFFSSFNGDNELIEKYRFALGVLKNAMNYKEVEKKVIGLYKTDGEEGIRNYFDTSLDCDTGDSALSSICFAEREYYEKVVKTYVFYDSIGCNVDGYYDVWCAVEFYGEKDFWDKLILLTSQNYSFLDFYGTEAREILNDRIIQLNRDLLEAEKNE